MSIERIKKLIALAGSANEHEARSAAYLACKLIREGEYELVQARSAHAPATHPWEEIFRSASWASAPPDPRPRRPPPDTRPRRHVASAIGVARRSGRCAVCDEAFEEGSDVAFPTQPADTKLGSVHADCRARWQVPVDTA